MDFQDVFHKVSIFFLQLKVRQKLHAYQNARQNLDGFAKFKAYSADDYTIRIDAISGASNYSVGSVITLESSAVAFNTAKSTVQFTGLAGVTQITLVSNLEKILQVTAVSITDEVYVVTSSKQY